MRSVLLNDIFPRTTIG